MFQFLHSSLRGEQANFNARPSGFVSLPFVSTLLWGKKRRSRLVCIFQASLKASKLTLDVRDSRTHGFMNAGEAGFIGFSIAVLRAETEFRIKEQRMYTFPFRQRSKVVAMNCRVRRDWSLPTVKPCGMRRLGLPRPHASRECGAQSTKLPPRPPPHRRPRLGVEPESCRLLKLEFAAPIPLPEIGPALKRQAKQHLPTSAVSPPPRYKVCGPGHCQNCRSKQP
jgi:hypothetical protein